MSYTARPPFTGGMSNQNQQQQQSGQSNNANIGASGIPNMPIMNNAASIPGNHLQNPSGSSPMSVLDQKVFQQQLMLQRQLLLQSTQYQQQQPTQQNQQAKFQQQPNQSTQALNRLMSDMLNANDKNGTNVAQQSQQLQQFVQLQALSNIMQMQQAAQQQQQKSFQQQSVPLPTNTTITPVARQNMPSMQKPPVNYPRPTQQSKAAASNVGSSPMQSRKSFPNAQKSTMPQMQSGMVSAPLNVHSGGSSKSTLPPQMPSAMTSATSSPKGYADIFAATLSNTQASMNITPSLTITKTNSPSSSATPPLAKNNQSLTNKPIPSMSSSQKSFLSEAISMSLGNVPIPVKANTQPPPSVSVTPTNKSTFAPTNKPIPVTPQKLNVPPNVPGLQKLSPTSPRTKQTPRKNTNPIRTNTQSLPVASVQSPPPLVVPQTVTKVTSPLAKPPLPPVATPAVPPTTATVANPSSMRVPPATPPKAAAPATPVAQAVAPNKPVQAVANNNSNATSAAKVNTPTPKSDTAVTKPSESTPKTAKPVESKVAEVKAKEPEKPAPAKLEKVNEAVKSEKSDALSSSAQPSTTEKKQSESKSKQTSPTVTSKNQSTPQEKSEKKEESPTSTAAKSSTDQTIKTPVARAPRAANTPVSTPSAVDTRVKRNRFKTIPYQSPTPEIELVSKISANEAINAHKKKVDDDKLTLFYKNEFLAVRNADGGFFLCQTMYNVYKSSPKLRIRWLSEDATNKNQYSLDFYDSTDIECVLTSVSLNKLGKGKFELTNAELDRIKNILKKALDVEKGIVNRLDVTEENPDGLDLSLYKDESQIEKKTSGKRKAAKEKAERGETEPAAKKRKVIAAKSRDTPTARAAKSNVDSSKASKAGSKSVKKSPAKKTPLSPKKAKTVKNSDTEEVKSTPVTKRAAAKRNLVSEANETQMKEADSKKAKGSDASKDPEAGQDVSKSEDKSPKQSNAKPSESAASSATETAEPPVGRPTRRNK